MSLEHSARVAYARDVFARTATGHDDYGTAVAQVLELRAALEQALAVVDEQAARLARRDADGEAMDRYRAYMNQLHREYLENVHRVPLAVIRRPVRRP
ncbi:MAG TPA: hypothetical protein VE465_13935 [Streptosporangiaceae bacterium]|nr:hypothetical protein [Streptosporangiaceae bacterium]